MTLVRWKPWHEIDKIFEHLPSLNHHSFDLATDVYEKDNAVVVEMHVPGINPDKIDIKVADNHLHISGSREEKEEIKREHYYHREIRHGNFERIIQLPCKVAQQGVKADFKDGILTVTLPKETSKETQKITVTRK